MGFIKGFTDGMNGRETGDLCKNCGHFGVPKTETPGNLLIEIILWCFLLVPGLIYSVWRMTSKKKICKKCRSTNLVPGDSKVALESRSGSGKKKCPECAEEIQAEAKICRYCRHQFAA